ncbi:hypothetical protein B0T24DRAFT_629192 [Lasiosphaeria ovina]|uniref:Uncharacterized protein n=1 Tax=Lasiosphaeria ovina TaxID=92902 RepID=A0AAE0K7U3_9PEZI|nr:hypothetical protein B0T24DRAFT_629192 [Lasiosphaeria ovina]
MRYLPAAIAALLTFCSPALGSPLETTSAQPNSSQPAATPTTARPTSVTVLPSFCTTRPTQTYYSSSGCDINCPNQINLFYRVASCRHGTVRM